MTGSTIVPACNSSICVLGRQFTYHSNYEVKVKPQIQAPSQIIVVSDKSKGTCKTDSYCSQDQKKTRMNPQLEIASSSSSDSSSSAYVFEAIIQELSDNTTTTPHSLTDDVDVDVTQEPSVEEETTMLTPVLTVSDPGVFYCPICTYPLSVPVYQCESGHFSCESCYKKVKDKCHTCRKPLRNKRCKGMEMVLESIKTPCQNVENGCKEKILTFSNKLEHENSCNYATMACPYFRCKYVGTVKSFYGHYLAKHPDFCKLISFNYVNSFTLGGEEPYLLLEEKEKIPFFLHQVIDPLGSFVCVSTALNVNFSYDVTAGSGDKLVYMKGSVEITTKCSPKPAKEKCFLIPHNILREANDGDSMLSLQLSIRK